LSDNLKPLIHELNSLNTHASLRGVYFTSSLTGAPSMIDHISETVEKQFALVSSKISSLSSGAPGLQRTFFIQSLFEQKIFPEASLANDVLRATASRQENFLRWGALGLAGIILLSITLTLSQHYKTQTVHLNTAAMALSDYKLLISTYSFSHPEINKLVPALDALVIADQNTAKAHLPWLLRFQLHRQAPLRDLTDQLYTRDLQTKLIPAVRYQLALTLEKGDAADTAHRYNLLKAYLMMGDPAHADKAFLHEWFYQVWQNPLAQNPDFRKHWDAAISGQIPALSSNAEVVQKTRATLNALPYELLSHAILRNEQTSDISLDIHDNTHIFLLPKTSDFKLLTASHIALANKQINEAVYIAINGNWVLGSKVSDTLPAAGLKKLQNTLMDEYVENYVSGWQQFLSKTQVHSFQSLQLLEQSLEVLTQHHSPLEQILTMVHQNTQLNDPHATLLTQKLSNRLNMQFGALNHVSLAEVQVKLQDLKTQIQTITHSQHPDIKALEVAQNMARQKGHDVILSLIQLANQMPEPLRQWLLSIAAQSRDLILSKAAAYTWQQWQLQVLPLCQSTVENHYPFAPASHKEISLYDFSRFFEKDGIFDQFFTLYLSPFVQTDLAQWQWKNVDGGRFDTAPQRLAQFERANIIKTLYFNKKNKLEASFTLSRDKDIQHYVWPVNTQNISVVLFNPEGKKKMLIMQGDWSIFRLINESKFKSLAEGKSYKLTFNHEEKQESSNYTAAYVLNAELINPFVPGVVDQFSCP
jgi:type VI protein secretion system component VasK